MFIVIAHYTIASANRDDVLDLLPRLTEASRAEPGNLSYDYYLKGDDPLGVLILEKYENAAAFGAHRASTHFAELALGGIIPLLSDRVIETFGE